MDTGVEMNLLLFCNFYKVNEDFKAHKPVFQKWSVQHRIILFRFSVSILHFKLDVDVFLANIVFVLFSLATIGSNVVHFQSWCVTIFAYNDSFLVGYLRKWYIFWRFLQCSCSLSSSPDEKSWVANSVSTREVKKRFLLTYFNRLSHAESTLIAMVVFWYCSIVVELNGEKELIQDGDIPLAQVKYCTQHLSQKKCD